MSKKVLTILPTQLKNMWISKGTSKFNWKMNEQREMVLSILRAIKKVLSLIKLTSISWSILRKEEAHLKKSLEIYETKLVRASSKAY